MLEESDKKPMDELASIMHHSRARRLTPKKHERQNSFEPVENIDREQDQACTDRK